MSELMRIYSNIQAMQNMNSLGNISDKMSMHQMRLATGKKINSAADDPAGYQLARSLETRKRGLDVALQNVSQAKNVLNVAEGGYQNIMDILQTVKEKATQAADYTLSSTQRTSIDDQVSALVSEIEDIVAETTFNGDSLIDGGYSGAFHTGEGSTDQLSVSLGDSDSAALSINSISLSSANGASSAISTVSTAIDTLAGRIQDVGEYKVRLASKEQSLSVASTNTEAIRSSVEDADFAKEQMEVMKLQILQQTAISSFAQANSAPQVVLSLFR
ncbi:MAG: flagellin [Candidatus Marinimicrobia bacterium]|nr:flagellin [Candidatus Neomarinimicrobiota bacterium]